MMPTPPQPTLWKLFFTWLLMGIQSFGGGTSTFILMHEACIKNGWLSEEEFVRDWALAQIAPGINLSKLTILIGHRLRGWPGLLVTTAGLLAPSALVTILMTAGFTVIRNQPVVQAAMRGILPATIGLSLAMGVKMGQPVLAKSYKEGPWRLGATLAIVTTAALLLALANLSPVLVLLLAGVAGVFGLHFTPIKVTYPENLPGNVTEKEVED